MEQKIITGVGSALVDILINESDAFLKNTSAIKGSMQLVDNKIIDQIMEQTTVKPVIVPGGSACNTVIGVACLGGQARFLGKMGLDQPGEFFSKDLQKNKVKPCLLTSTLPTGRVLSIITPDTQRSMLTYLGASAEIKADEITPSCFENNAIVHLEGYLLFNHDLMRAAVQAASQAGAKISLDLASFTVVEESKNLLNELMEKYIDIVIANEDEALAFTGQKDEIKAVQALAHNVELAALKVGPRGSYICCGQEVTKIKALSGGGPVIDTTGAGDLWAAGFLFGLVQGLPLEQCGALGSACGYEVCQVMGANIPEQGWARIKQLLTIY